MITSIIQLYKITVHTHTQWFNRSEDKHAHVSTQTRFKVQAVATIGAACLS